MGPSLHTQLRMREGMKSDEWNKRRSRVRMPDPFLLLLLYALSFFFLTLYRLKVHKDHLRGTFFSFLYDALRILVSIHPQWYLKLKTIEGRIEWWRKKTSKFSTRVKTVIRKMLWFETWLFRLLVEFFFSISETSPTIVFLMIFSFILGSWILIYLHFVTLISSVFWSI